MGSVSKALRARVAMAARAAMIAPLLVLSACGGSTPDYDLLAKGPTTQFDAASLRLVVENQNSVLKQLAIMAGVNDPTAHRLTEAEWAQIGAAAFGRARLECNAYITEIMKVEEHRRTINQQLSLTGAATAGVLGASGVAGAAIAITAIAFGLAQGTVDNVTTGLLYSLGAEPVQSLVNKLRSAYVEKLKVSSWKDRATSMNLIYGYLELCTPAVLREKIKSAIVKAQPEATDVDNMGGPPQVTILDSASAPLPKSPQRNPPPNADPREPVTTAEVREFQTDLCVPADGDPGAIGSNASTRVAIRNYIAGLSGGDPATRSDVMTGRTLTFLRNAVARARKGETVATCDVRGMLNAFEVGQIENAPDASERVKSLQVDINEKLDTADRLTPDGSLATLRDLIGKLRKKEAPTDTSRALDYRLFRIIYPLAKPPA